MEKRVEIITSGDEILIGQVVDTNAAFIGDELTKAGIPIGWMTTIGDDRQQILHALRRAKSRASAIIITGGLGPTPDDLTKACLVEFFKDQLEVREKLLISVKKRFSDSGAEMPALDICQAEFPKGASEISNRHGTATGIHYFREGKEWFSLPGVPYEMKEMIKDYVIPRLTEQAFGNKVGIRVLKTAGIGESSLISKLSNLVEAGSHAKIAFLPKTYGVDIKLSTKADSRNESLDLLLKAEKLLTSDLEDYLFGRDCETLPSVIGQLARNRKIRISIAESCTGGLVAKLLTDVPGSSDYFVSGIVAYSNKAKIDFLGVSENVLRKRGAVSEEVAEEMAKGMLLLSRADIAISVTGIAGPTGGTADKPVGLVFIGIADKTTTDVLKHQFIHNRGINRQRAAMTVLKLLHDRLKTLDS